MHEALIAALSWGFKEMGVNRVEAQVHPGNEPSLRLLRRLRFVRRRAITIGWILGGPTS